MKRKLWMRYFEYSRSERIGSAALSALCVIFLAAPEVWRWFLPARTSDFSDFKKEIEAFKMHFPQAVPVAGIAAAEPFPFDPNMASFDDFLRLGLSERTANSILNYRDRGGQFFSADDFQKIYTLPAADFERLRDFIEIQVPERERFTRGPEAEERRPAAVFSFDPNTASFDDFLRLGLRERVAQAILNYRSAGGVFRQKTDFQKIYILPAEEYRRLEPHIQIAENQSNAPAPRPQVYAASGGGSAVPNAPPNPAAGPLDINRATAEDWQRLPGLGAYRAERIVYFREKLGGFASVGQVAEARGLPDSVFQKIKPLLTLATPVFKKINLNSATDEELNGHPYIDKRQADLILAYRAQHGRFKSVDEISSIGAFKNRDWLEKVKPYLSVD